MRCNSAARNLEGKRSPRRPRMPTARCGQDRDRVGFAAQGFEALQRCSDGSSTGLKAGGKYLTSSPFHIAAKCRSNSCLSSSGERACSSKVGARPPREPVTQRVLTHWCPSFSRFAETKNVIASYEKCLSSGDMDALAALRESIEVRCTLRAGTFRACEVAHFIFVL